MVQNANVDKILTSKKGPFGKKDCKSFFFLYNDDDYEIKPLQSFDETKCMSFLMKDYNFLKRQLIKSGPKLAIVLKNDFIVN